MKNEDIRKLLFDYGFDVCWATEDDQLYAQLDKRALLINLIRDAEVFYKKCINYDWLPKNQEAYLLPIKGFTTDQPDRLIYRYVIKDNKVELVAGEFSVIFNVILSSSKRKTIDNEEKTMAFYGEWINELIRLDQETLKAPMEIKEMTDFWIITRVLYEFTAKEQTRRYEPWSWPESIKMAVAKEGNWFSLAIQRLPDKMGSLPKGGGARIGAGWFDDFINSLH